MSEDTQVAPTSAELPPVPITSFKDLDAKVESRDAENDAGYAELNARLSVLGGALKTIGEKVGELSVDVEKAKTLASRVAALEEAKAPSNDPPVPVDIEARIKYLESRAGIS